MFCVPTADSQDVLKNVSLHERLVCTSNDSKLSEGEKPLRLILSSECREQKVNVDSKQKELLIAKRQDSIVDSISITPYSKSHGLLNPGVRPSYQHNIWSWVSIFSVCVIRHMNDDECSKYQTKQRPTNKTCVLYVSCQLSVPIFHSSRVTSHKLIKWNRYTITGGKDDRRLGF